ncbi:MAG TPA: hypothetical protein VM364_22850 [Vicinamibacterales bacterium]|nr:hypothetical protein [Vicinamibacterales bacterium]
MQTHVKVLAVLFIVLSALGVLAAVGLGAAFGIAGMATAASDVEDAAMALPILGITGTVLTMFLLALALPGLIAGFGLLKYKPWARILGIVLCALNLINIPFGTILGIYGLWVLLNSETERLFAAPPATV